jgi:O-antigen ligase
MLIRQRVLLALVLLGNAVCFAGVDPLTRLGTALLVLWLVVDVRLPTEVPRLPGWSALILGGLVLVQLVPLPEAVRQPLQPGLAPVLQDGLYPLSVAPWSTLQAGASLAVVVALALVVMRVAATRTGLPDVLGLLALTGGVLGVLGLVGEAEAPEKVLLVRANVGGDAYGPFLNSNHFAQAIELTLPAAMVLLAVALRRAARSSTLRARSVMLALAAAVAAAIAGGAVIRSGSRGGMLFLGVAVVLTLPMWWRRRGGRRWPFVVIGTVVLALALVLASTRLPTVREEFSQLLVVEGVEGNTRWDLWRATLDLWSRAPLLGTGLGSYRYVIGLDKPATGEAVLEQAHNDWLEWLATGGLVAGAAAILLLWGLMRLLRPGHVRRLRFEFRYPLAGCALALAATVLHEAVGFGLHTPLNRYLLAVWVGVACGAVSSRRRRAGEEEAAGREFESPPPQNTRGEA